VKLPPTQKKYLINSNKDGILQFYPHRFLAVHVGRVSVAQLCTGTASNCIIDIDAYDINQRNRPLITLLGLHTHQTRPNPVPKRMNRLVRMY
jgi:hypothetical protein